MVTLLTDTLETFINIYIALMILRFLLTWFPTVDWYNPPFSILSQLTDPYINLFRNILPSFGGIDFLTPLISILALQFGGQILIALINGIAGSVQGAAFS
jgi:YggT family protein